MQRDLKKWARAASITALTGLIGSTAMAADRPPVKLKAKQSPAKIVQRAQNSDEDLFDSQLVGKPRLNGASDSAQPEGCQPRVCEPPAQSQSPYSPFTDPSLAQTPMRNDTAAGAFRPFDFGGEGIAGLTAATRTPSMMGDFFGIGTTTLYAPAYFFTQSLPQPPFPPPPPPPQPGGQAQAQVQGGPLGTIPVKIPVGATAGIMKLAENSSPIPRDRIFVNYSYFPNVALSTPGVNVNRITPGFEKTFFDGMTSFELRMPFATTLDSDIRNLDRPGGGSSTSVEFGNLNTIFKSYLYNDSRLAVTGGLGIAFPTADDVTASLSNGMEVMQIQNKAVRMMPFLGSLYTPGDRLFVQSIVQVDAPLNGQDTFFNADFTGLKHVGIYTPQSYVYFDTALGYWFYNNPEPGSRISGLAGMLELHYNSSLNKSDVINVSAFPNSPLSIAQIGRADTFNQFNIIFGATIELMRTSNLQFGYATTVSGDRIFDGEFRCNYNYFFGRNLYGRSYRPSGI